MDNLKQITKEISIAGQPSPQDIEDAHQNGFRTVVNLRTPDEPGFLADEERQVESLGLTYASIPVSPDTLDDVAVARFSQALESIDGTPALIHCRSGGRAGIMTLLHLAVTHGWTLHKALEEGQKMGDIAPKDGSPYRAFFETYIREHSVGERIAR